MSYCVDQLGRSADWRQEIRYHSASHNCGESLGQGESNPDGDRDFTSELGGRAGRFDFELTDQNLLTQAPTQNLPSLFVQKTLALVSSLQERKWSDEEIEDDLTYLSTELKGRLEGLTTYDEYLSELESGKLVWSPTHESEDFWKENGARLGQEDSGKGIK